MVTHKVIWERGSGVLLLGAYLEQRWSKNSTGVTIRRTFLTLAVVGFAVYGLLRTAQTAWAIVMKISGNT